MGTALVLGVATGSCFVTNEKHCANLDGDPTCRERGGATLFCSACTAKNDGCVTSPPADDCSSPAGDEAAGTTDSSGDDSTAAGTSGSDGTSPECTANGTVDPACTAPDAPYCIDGSCVGCSDETCAAVFEGRPVCHEPSGECVGCTMDNTENCAAQTPYCSTALECTGCTEHSDCDTGSCADDVANCGACDLETNTCIAAERIRWVKNFKIATCDDMAGCGGPTNPISNVASALEDLDLENEGPAALIVIGGGTETYEPIAVNLGAERTLAVVGAGDQPPVFASETDPAFAVGGPRNHLFVKGVVVDNNTVVGATCVSGTARLWLDDVLIRQGEAEGVNVRFGKARIRRTQIVGNRGGGLTVEDSGQVWLEGSVIADNGGNTSPTDDDARGVIVRTEGDLSINFSTIVANQTPIEDAQSPPPVNLDCDPTSVVEVRNSIVFAPSLQSIECTVATIDTSLVDTIEVSTQTNRYEDAWRDDWFVSPGASNFRLRFDSDHPARDLAVWQIGDPLFDIDGDGYRQDPTATEYAGADRP